jgi:alpha-beta hydrolase superfamily lysophospholipase
MKPFYISEIKTKDGLLHQGIYFAPKQLRKRAVLWVHGLSAAFYNDINLYEAVTNACEKEGWGFALFNNRGHDLIAGIRKYDGTPPNGYSYYPGGAGNEIFEECIFDIDAGVDFLVEKGFTEVVIVGHSTGANKACYYAATEKNSHVVGVVLLGPMSDRLETSISQEKHKQDLELMYQLIKDGKGDELLLGYHFFPITPKRYISLFEPGSTEDVFDYGDQKPTMTSFSAIKLPLLVVLAENDEAADRPMREIKKVFDSHATSEQYKSVIIPDALHKFHDKENNVATAIVDWVKTI